MTRDTAPPAGDEQVREPFPDLEPEDGLCLPDGTEVCLLEVLDASRPEVVGIRFRLRAGDPPQQGVLVKAHVAAVRRNGKKIWP